MNLKGTKTEANLMAAFAGESQARNKYTYYASKAKKDGYNQIAAIFEETANNEKEHAKLWFKLLHGGSIPGTIENLNDAAAGENYEWTDMYATMAKEARDVGKALKKGIEPARKQVARIVGRDTGNLSEEEIIKATVETVAENTTDGVISPILYALIGGPVLLWGYKAVNTLDSMVGYMDEKYRDIGWSSARLDDALNLIPARLTALLMVCAAFLTGQDGKNAFLIVKRDHATT